MLYIERDLRERATVTNGSITASTPLTATFYSRYTTLPSAIDVLRRKALTLLSPDSWDDKNDSTYISIYREKLALKSVLALCFTQAAETYHHWRVFAPTSAGIRLDFDPSALSKAVKSVPGLRLEDVQYLTLEALRKKTLETARLPFLKRIPFEPEHEARLLWESSTEERESFDLTIPISAISRMTLSPWLHSNLVDGVKELLKSIDGCSRLKISRSTLIGNEEWIRRGRDAV